MILDYADDLHYMDAARLADFTRFPRSQWDWGKHFFTPTPGGVDSYPFQKYVEMFEKRHPFDWDPRFPAILEIRPNSTSCIVEGHRRLITWVYTERPGKIPVLHCYGRHETDYWLRRIYKSDLKPPINQHEKKTQEQWLQLST